MSDAYPSADQRYSHPYTICSQCGNNCSGSSCLGPNSQYVEKNSHSRFSRPPVPTVSNYACYNSPQTCKTVSSLYFNKGEYSNPLPVYQSKGCETPNNFSGIFQVSQVRYATL